MKYEEMLEKYKGKLANYYDEEGKLVQYPSKRPLRILALLKVAEDFEKERTYTEKEVNEVIRKNITFSDHELIRREMYQYKIMNRLPNGSQYWLEEEKTEFKF